MPILYKEDDDREGKVKESSVFKKRETVILTCILIVLTAACIVTGIFCMSNINNVWLRSHFLTCALVYSLLASVLCAVAVIFAFLGKSAWAKALLSVLILLLFALIVWLILQKTGFFAVFLDAESLQAYLERVGVWMPIMYVLLQFLQVVVLPIPSIVSTVAGIALFGPFWTTVYSFIGIMTGSVLAFVIGRKWGQKAVEWIIGADSLEKWQKRLKRKDNIILTAMFLLPLFPDDILCFIAGLSSMTMTYFLVMVSISRILAIACTCYSVNFIPFNTWWGLTIWGIILFVTILACVLLYKNMDKLQEYILKRRNRKRKEKPLK